MNKSTPTRYVLVAFLRPVYRSARYGLLANIQLWGETFWIEWDALTVDKKLAWILFLNHTIAIITLIEVFLLKKR